MHILHLVIPQLVQFVTSISILYWYSSQLNILFLLICCYNIYIGWEYTPKYKRYMMAGFICGSMSLMSLICNLFLFFPIDENARDGFMTMCLFSSGIPSYIFLGSLLKNKCCKDDD